MTLLASPSLPRSLLALLEAVAGGEEEGFERRTRVSLLRGGDGGAPCVEFELFFATGSCVSVYRIALHFGARVVMAHTALTTHTRQASSIQAACTVKLARG